LNIIPLPYPNFTFFVIIIKKPTSARRQAKTSNDAVAAITSFINLMD